MRLLKRSSTATPLDRLRAAKSRGKPKKLLRGSWVSDLAALKKAIFLCSECCRRWDAKANRYVARRIIPSSPWAISDCDGCGQRNLRCQMFRHEDVIR